MPLWRTHKKPRPGQTLSARTVRETSEAADAISRLQAEPPLAIDFGGMGPLIRYAGPVFGAYVAVVASGGISARSGSTPGSGKVSLQAWNGTFLQALSGTNPVTAYNISSAAGGITAGSYCIILKIASSYWIITSECAS